jgi:hypothetical protein
MEFSWYFNNKKKAHKTQTLFNRFTQTVSLEKKKAQI